MALASTQGLPAPSHSADLHWSVDVTKTLIGRTRAGVSAHWSDTARVSGASEADAGVLVTTFVKRWL